MKRVATERNNVLFILYTCNRFVEFQELGGFGLREATILSRDEA